MCVDFGGQTPLFAPMMRGICVMRLDGSWLPEVRAALEELAMRVAAKTFSQTHQGATARTVALIDGLMARPAAR